MIFIRSRNKPQEYGLPFQLLDRRAGRHPEYHPNDRVFVTYPDEAGACPKARTVRVGNPIRGGIAAR